MSDKYREKRTLSDEIDKYFFPDELHEEGFELVEEEQTEFDGEKKYTKNRVVLKETSTGLFFETHYDNWGHGDRVVEKNLMQVFPKIIEKVIYV